MSNIAIVTDSLPVVTGGSEVWTGIVARILEKEGHTIDIYHDGLVQESVDKIQAPQAVARIFNKQQKKYSVVIGAPHYCSEVEHPNVIAFFHGSYLSYANACKDFCSSEKTDQRLELWKQQHSAALKHRVFACSESCRIELKSQGIFVEKVLSHAVDPSIFFPGQRAGSEFIYPARFAYFEKGFDIIKDIGFKGIPITCFTDGIFKYGSAKSHPFIKREELAEKYRASRALVFPTRYEGAGLVTLEALASDLPVLTTRTGYGHELSKEFPELICEQNTPEEYIQRLNDDLLEKYKGQFVEFVNDVFPYSKFVSNIKALAKK